MFYVIKHHSEEFTCPECGAPNYVGERAYQDGKDGPVYCSAYCGGHRPQKLPPRQRHPWEGPAPTACNLSPNDEI